MNADVARVVSNVFSFVYTAVRIADAALHQTKRCISSLAPKGGAAAG
jgi:hypothetical protein